MFLEKKNLKCLLNYNTSLMSKLKCLLLRNDTLRVFDHCYK